MQCRDCLIEFREKRSKRGFSDQCDDCSKEQDEPQKYLGFNDGTLNKSTNTSIYRGSNKEVRSKIANQKARVG